MTPSGTGGGGMAFGIELPARILFGRGEAAKAPTLIAAWGARGIVVHGASAARAAPLVDGLCALGVEVLPWTTPKEPTLAMLEAALDAARPFRPDWVAAIGGGAAMDMGKALAALIPQPTPPLPHLEGGAAPALPLGAPPLPFAAIPTTAGTGSEATRNAVIGLDSGGGRKVSLRDARMLARLAIVDPALTDRCPRGVTLASGLDAVTQLVEAFVSRRATPFTDALAREAIGPAMAALVRLMEEDDAAARDRLSWGSLCGGIALANAGLGAVHGLAGVIGGRTGAAHGAICGALLGPVLAMNRRLAAGAAAGRLDEAMGRLAPALGCAGPDVPAALAAWTRRTGLPGLAAQGLDPADHAGVAEAGLGASSMKGNPVAVTAPDLVRAMAEAG